MNQNLGLKILGRIMNWTDDRAREEFAWLKLMARLKYDGYRDFRAGMRFIESLATWLQQFKPHERETAYAFVRSLASLHRSWRDAATCRAVLPALRSRSSSSAWRRPSATSSLTACSSTRMPG